MYWKVYPKQLDHGNRNHKLVLAEQIFFSSQKNKWTRPLTKKKKVSHCLWERSCSYFTQSGISHYCRTRLQVEINHYQFIIYNLLQFICIRMSPVTQAPLCFSHVTISRGPEWMLSKEGLPTLHLLLAPPCESQTAAELWKRRRMTTLNL